MTQEEMSRLLTEYASVLDRVLSRGGVFYFHPDYEDYRQELNLTILKRKSTSAYCGICWICGVKGANKSLVPWKSQRWRKY